MDNSAMHLKHLEQKALEVIEAGGFCPATIEVSYKIPFLRIEKFCDGLDKSFSTDLLEEYVIHIEQFVRDGEWTKHRYNIDRHAALLLLDCAKSENPIWCQYHKTHYKYLPAAEYVILAATITDSYGPISESYAASTRHYLRQFFCHMEQSGTGGCEQIDSQCIRDFIARQSDKKPKEIRNMISALRILLNYLEAKDICHVSIDPALYGPPVKNSAIIPSFSRAEVKAMLEAVDTSTDAGKRNFAIILVAITTGLRGCDIVSLRCSEIDWVRGEISTTQKKSATPLVTALLPAVGNALADYLVNGRPDSRDAHIFLTVKAPFRPFAKASAFGTTFETICAKAGITKIRGRGFHSLRRSAGTWMAQTGTPVETIAQVLGHATIRSSMPYIAFEQATLDTCPLDLTLVPLSEGGAYA